MPTVVPSTIHLPYITLSYLEWPGQRGPIICLPGMMGHKGSFNSLARALSPEYRLFALDLRGRGDSDKPAEGYGFAYHARDILAFADALGLDTFIVIGHSFGATAATYLASIRPGRVRALTLLDGGVEPETAVLESMRPALRRLSKVYPSMDAYLDAMRALPFYRPWSPALEKYLRDDVAIQADGSVCPKASAEALEKDLDLHFYYSMRLHFTQLRCPVLFLRPLEGLLGDQGHIFTDQEASAVVRSLPTAWRVDLPGVNHYTMLLHDDPPLISPLREFLDNIDKGAAEL